MNKSAAVILSESSQSRHTVLGEHRPLDHTVFTESDGGRMMADIVLIRPGVGNKRDNNYYSPDILRRDAHKFSGAKMYATNHKEDDQTVNNWVATITECGKRFLDDGSPIARIAVHDTGFYDKLKTLDRQGLLESMHNSILAVGEARDGTVDGKPAKIVESINQVKSVDFVARAGAGGHVLKLIEQFVEHGDLDLLTVEALEARRPDIVSDIRAQALILEEAGADKTGQRKNPDRKELLDARAEIRRLRSKLGEMSAAQRVVKSGNQQLQEDDKMAENRFSEMAAELAEKSQLLGNSATKISELEDEVATLREQVAMSEQAATKAQAKELLREGYGKVLPATTIVRICETIDGGWFEQDADVEGVVKELAEEEEKYLESVAADIDDDDEDIDDEDIDDEEDEDTDVEGMGESFAESDMVADTRTPEEKEAAISNVMSKFGLA